MTATACPPFALDRAKYADFCREFKMGSFLSQRFGQAFVNHFRVDRMNWPEAHHLYNMKSAEEAKKFILNHFSMV